MYDVGLYQTESGKCPVSEYLALLARNGKAIDSAKIITSVNRLKEFGMSVNQAYPHTIRKVEGDIWELRPDNHRVFFFYFANNKFVLLHAYQKKMQKAPSHEISKAENEMKDFIRRN